MRRREFMVDLCAAGAVAVLPWRAASASAGEAPAPGSDPFRRVVTGIDAEGRSVVTSQGPPPLVIHPRHPEQVLTSIWTCGSVPADLDEWGDRESFVFPAPEGGITILRNRLPPDSVRYTDEEGRPREPGPAEGMHRTPSLDFVQVLSGELWLVLDGGEEVHLRAGDCVIQRGTVHAWRNRGSTPATFVAVMIATELPT